MSVRRQRRELAGVELELTAFINPMVVLVCFLLVNVVFSHSAVLDLQLPGPGGAAAAAAPVAPLQLEVTLRAQVIEIGDRGRGLLATLPNIQGQPDLAGLSAALLTLKQSHPDQRAASLLLEPAVPYQRLVQVMDAVRAHRQPVNGRRQELELFPQIALGDAPTP